MSRLGVFYALTDNEVDKLRSLPAGERYEYMLEEIEESLLETPRGCELDKAWEGMQYCLGGGQWKEENSVPTNIIFGGEFLVETEDEIITLKNHDDGVNHVLGWSEDILSFYENAQKENYQVIFTVDL